MTDIVKIAADATVTAPWSTTDQTAFIIDSGELKDSSEKSVLRNGQGKIAEIVWHSFDNKVTFSFTALTDAYPKAKGAFFLIDDLQDIIERYNKKPEAPTTPQKPKQDFSLENFTPTKRQYRVRHIASGLYLGKLHKSGPHTTNLSPTGTICKRRPTADQVLYSWYEEGSIQNQFGNTTSLSPSDIKIERA
jgi:hypothetical protein